MTIGALGALDNFTGGQAMLDFSGEKPRLDLCPAQVSRATSSI